MTDEAPFQNIPEEDIRPAVLEYQNRPNRPREHKFVTMGLTDAVWELIETSWAQEERDRPKFTEIAARLRPLIVYGKISHLAQLV